MKILVVNGPNINMLGIREPAIYGEETYEDICKKIRYHCMDNKVDVEIFQSNHEGEIVDKIQSAFGKVDGIVINAAAYSHTSIAILDAIRSVAIPTVEVHISDITAREEYRKHSYLTGECIDNIIGEGTKGYLLAIDRLIKELK